MTTAYEKLQTKLSSSSRTWLIKGEETFINGDGETSRDFCFIENAVQANLLAATALEHGLILGTRNIKDVKRTGVSLLNPFLP